LRVLIEGLPPDGPRARLQAGHHWQDNEQLLAIVADRIAEVGVGIIRTLGGKAKKPKPLPRPGKKTPDRTKIGNRGGRTVAETKAFLDSLSAPAQPPAPVTPAGQLEGAVDEHRALTEKNTAVLQAIHDQL
jgi:hypothetical protein